MNQYECDCDLTVYFNTGFEYPYGSNHVWKFGGEENGHMDMSEFIWTANDADGILQKLQGFEYPLPHFEQFEASVKGTETLFASLANYEHSEFLFGCFVYHQLQYKQKLTGIFQTGRCHVKDCWHAFNT